MELTAYFFSFDISVGNFELAYKKQRYLFTDNFSKTMVYK